MSWRVGYEMRVIWASTRFDRLIFSAITPRHCRVCCSIMHRWLLYNTLVVVLLRFVVARGSDCFLYICHETLGSSPYGDNASFVLCRSSSGFVFRVGQRPLSHLLQDLGSIAKLDQPQPDRVAHCDLLVDR